MAKSFIAQVDDWIKASQVRLDAVVKQSAQDVVEAAQTPRAKGGNMPVDTGFLRNSMMASTKDMPSGKGTPRPPSDSDDESDDEWDEQAVMLVIFRAKPGETIHIGWVANYARAMERRYAFMRLAAQQWRKIVNKNARKLRNMKDAKPDT